MKIDVHVHHHFDGGHSSEVEQQLRLIRIALGKITMTQEELVKQLNDVNTQLTKVGAEIAALSAKSDQQLALIQTLQDTIANNPVDPAVKAAADAVQANAQQLDDMIPDSPTPVPVP